MGQRLRRWPTAEAAFADGWECMAAHERHVLLYWDPGDPGVAPFCAAMRL